MKLCEFDHLRAAIACLQNAIGGHSQEIDKVYPDYHRDEYGAWFVAIHENNVDWLRANLSKQRPEASIRTRTAFYAIDYNRSSGELSVRWIDLAKRRAESHAHKNTTRIRTKNGGSLPATPATLRRDVQPR